jgi:AraC-like DNA-binding protein
MVATGTYLAVTLGVQSYNLLLGVATPAPIALANMAVTAIASVAAAWFLVQPRSQTWLDPAGTAEPVSLSKVEAAVLASLRKALESDRIYLKEGLTIGALAEHLGTGQHVLRSVINRGMGYRNFNDFLHAWRIREACEQLARLEHAREPVLAIAMSVGYGSVGAFNRAFKDRTGLTPTAYRRTHLGGTVNSTKKVA